MLVSSESNICLSIVRTRPACQCGEAQFKASNSWVHNFAKHYKLNWGKPHGEAADVPVEPTEEGVARLKELIKQYAPRDVYNADEFALY